jgi:hypothetical protein
MTDEERISLITGIGAVSRGVRRDKRCPAGPAASYTYYDAANGWTVEPGAYEVIVGRRSLDEQAPRAGLVIR